MVQIKVLIADTRRLFAEALGIALSDYPEFEVIDHYPAHGREVVNLVDLHSPDVVLLDYWIGEMQGPAVARLIQKRSPGCRVVLVSWFLNPPEQLQPKGVEAESFISKDADIASVAELVLRLYAEKSTIAPKGIAEAAPQLESSASEDSGELKGLISLTPREMDILTLIAFRPKDIAETLKISEKTVRNHVQHILDKTGARSIVGAVAMARRHGMI